MPKTIVTVLLTLCLLAACSAGTGDPGLEKRVGALEKRVEALQQSQAADTALVKKELAEIRANLSLVLETLAADKDASGEHLEGKAKQLAKESMEKLLKLSRDILDRLEEKLKDLPEQPAEPKTGEKTEI